MLRGRGRPGIVPRSIQGAGAEPLTQYIEYWMGQSLLYRNTTTGTPRVVIDFAQELRDELEFTGGAFTNNTTDRVCHDGASSFSSDYTVKIVNSTGDGSALIDVHAGGAQIASSNYWWNTQDNSATTGDPTDLADTPGPLLKRLFADIDDHGGVINALRIDHGQTDATNIGNSQVSADLYEQVMQDEIIGGVRTYVGNPNLPILVQQVGRHESGSDLGYQRLREIQTRLTQELSNVYIVTQEYDLRLGTSGSLTVGMTSGDATLTAADTTGISNDLRIQGTGIPDNTYVLSFVANTSITLTNNPTATNASATILLGDRVHLYPQSGDPLDSNGNTTHDVTQGSYLQMRRSVPRTAAIAKRQAPSNKRPGAYISSIDAQVGETLISLHFTHDLGTDFTNEAGAIDVNCKEMFRFVSGASTVLTITDIDKISATQIDFTISSGLPDADLSVTVAYGQMQRKNYKYFIRDDAGWPLRPMSPDTDPANCVVTPAPMTRGDLQSAGFSNVVAQWDATLSESYSGSGTTWANCIDTPADGSAKSAYDLTLANLTFNGSAGDIAAYFSSAAGTGYAEIGSNTTFLQQMHQSGTDFTWIFFYKPASTTSFNLMSTQNTASSIGIGIESSTQIVARQYGDTAAATGVSGGTVNSGAWNFAMIGHSAAGNGTRRAVNTRTVSAGAQTYNASVGSAGVNLHLFGRNDTTARIPSGSELVGACVLNTYVDATLLGQLLDYYNALHGRTYA